MHDLAKTLDLTPKGEEGPVQIDPVARMIQLDEQIRQLRLDALDNGIEKRFEQEAGDELWSRFVSLFEYADAKGHPRGVALDYAAIERHTSPKDSIKVSEFASGAPDAMAVSRYELVQMVMSQSSRLSDTLKVLIPCVPFVETGYQDDIVSPDGAEGPWQFMEATAKKYGLVTRLRDSRRDFVAATLAARRYFEDIAQRLEHDRAYQTLRERYQLTGDLHALMTINAFNSGEWHMQHALEVFADADDAECQAAIADALAANDGNGDLALLDCLTRWYPSQYKKYQAPHAKEGKVPPYYGDVSSAYALKALAFGRMTGAGMPDPRLPERVSEGPTPDPRGVEESTAGIPHPTARPERKTD